MSFTFRRSPGADESFFSHRDFFGFEQRLSLQELKPPSPQRSPLAPSPIPVMVYPVYFYPVYPVQQRQTPLTPYYPSTPLYQAARTAGVWDQRAYSAPSRPRSATPNPSKSDIRVLSRSQDSPPVQESHSHKAHHSSARIQKLIARRRRREFVPSPLPSESPSPLRPAPEQSGREETLAASPPEQQRIVDARPTFSQTLESVMANIDKILKLPDQP